MDILVTFKVENITYTNQRYLLISYWYKCGGYCQFIEFIKHLSLH